MLQIARPVQVLHAGLPNQFLYVYRRESSVGQVIGHMSRLFQTASLRCLR